MILYSYFSYFVRFTTNFIVTNEGYFVFDIQTQTPPRLTGSQNEDYH